MAGEETPHPWGSEEARGQAGRRRNRGRLGVRAGGGKTPHPWTLGMFQVRLGGEETPYSWGSEEARGQGGRRKNPWRLGVRAGGGDIRGTLFSQFYFY